MLHSRCGLTDQDCLGQLLVSPQQRNLLRIRMVGGGGDGVKESGVIVAPLSLIITLLCSGITVYSIQCIVNSYRALWI